MFREDYKIKLLGIHTEAFHNLYHTYFFRVITHLSSPPTSVYSVFIASMPLHMLFLLVLSHLL